VRLRGCARMVGRGRAAMWMQTRESIRKDISRLDNSNNTENERKKKTRQHQMTPPCSERTKQKRPERNATYFVNIAISGLVLRRKVLPPPVAIPVPVAGKSSLRCPAYLHTPTSAQIPTRVILCRDGSTVCVVKVFTSSGAWFLHCSVADGFRF
jgi:hypothetical protein